MKLSELTKALKAVCLEVFQPQCAHLSGKELSRLVRACACEILTNINCNKMSLEEAVREPMDKLGYHIYRIW